MRDNDRRLLGPKAKGKTDKVAFNLAMEELRKWEAEIEEEKRIKRKLTDPDVAKYTQEMEQALRDEFQAKEAAIEKHEDDVGVVWGVPLRDDQRLPQSVYDELWDSFFAYDNFKGSAKVRFNAFIAKIQAERAAADARIAELNRLSGAIGKPIGNEENQAGAETPKTAVELLDKFLAYQDERREAGRLYDKRRQTGEKAIKPAIAITGGALDRIQRYAKKLRLFLGDRPWDGTQKCATDIVTDWRKYVENLYVTTKMEPGGFNEYMKIASQFLRWAETNEHLDKLPKGLSKLLKKEATKKKGVRIPLGKIHQLWAVADEREKAYIALGLNLGYTQKDISDLEHADIKNGYIINDREKTGVLRSHKLWAVTMELIRRTSNGETRVYVDDMGEPLVDDDTGRKDLVGQAWAKLCNRADVTGFSFGKLRKTSATLVEHFDKTLTDTFLSHSDGRVATSYLDFNDPKKRGELDEVIASLESEYKLTLDEKDTEDV